MGAACRVVDLHHVEAMKAACSPAHVPMIAVVMPLVRHGTVLKSMQLV